MFRVHKLCPDSLASHTSGGRTIASNSSVLFSPRPVLRHLSIQKVHLIFPISDIILDQLTDFGIEDNLRWIRGCLRNSTSRVQQNQKVWTNYSTRSNQSPYIQYPHTLLFRPTPRQKDKKLLAIQSICAFIQAAQKICIASCTSSM